MGGTEAYNLVTFPIHVCQAVLDIERKNLVTQGTEIVNIFPNFLGPLSFFRKCPEVRVVICRYILSKCCNREEPFTSHMASVVTKLLIDFRGNENSQIQVEIMGIGGKSGLL